MSTEEKKKGFQPPPPAIPGVPARAAQPLPQPQRRKTESNPPAQQRSTKSSHIVLGSSIALVLVVATLWWARALTRSSAPVAAAPERTAPAAAKTPDSLPVAPGPIASTAELAHDWDAKQFLYRDASGATSPALLVRLPKGQYWAISLRAPWGSCQLSYVTDLQQIASEYGLSAAHPMVVDPCSHAVFDLSKYANGPNGLVRGAIEAGSELRPPFAIEVDVKDGQILATRSE